MTAEQIQDDDCRRPCVRPPRPWSGDGRHWQAVVVSAISLKDFASLRRHQKVYATLGNKMHNDEVHALSMKTFTPAEWAKAQA